MHTLRLVQVLIALLILTLAPIGVSLAAPEFYQLDYRVRLRPERAEAVVVIDVRQRRDLLREVRFRRLPDWHRDFSGDGSVEVTDDAVIWRPPASGGRLRLVAKLDHKRGQGGYDSLITERWAIFRGDDIVPAAAIRSVKGARAQARLQIDAPDGWSVVSPFPKGEDGWFQVDDPERNFDRPVGWMVAGKLGVRRDTVAGVQVAIAAPTGQGVRRMDMLAFLNWNLPGLKQVFADFPERLLILSAGDPMWRGGLSGPRSLFIHADRPLISANGTSTLLHELVHLAQGYRADPGGDWIVEGVAEYYSIEIMRRSGTLSAERARRALESVSRWGENAERLETDRSSGAVTARAVRLLADMDAELRQRSDGKASLDDVVRALSERHQRVSLRALQQESERIAGAPLDSLKDVDGPARKKPDAPAERPARVSRGSS